MSSDVFLIHRHQNQGRATGADRKSDSHLKADVRIKVRAGDR